MSFVPPIPVEPSQVHPLPWPADREADVAAMEAALLGILNAVRAYLPPDGIPIQACLRSVIYEVDNPSINPILARIEASANHTQGEG